MKVSVNFSAPSPLTLYSASQLQETLGCLIFAECQKSNPATSFSHPFYLVIHEYAKKVEKSCHLGVPFRMHYLCSSFPIEIELLRKKVKFEPFVVLLHAHMTSQSIRHPKLY